MHRCLGCMKEYKEEYQVCPFCGYEVGTPPKEAYHMVPGSLLGGRYIVGKVLGFGGFGVTYIGFDTVLSRKVAIKEYLPSEFSTRVPGQTEVMTYEGERTEQFNSGLGKFLEEAAMLAKLQAANGVVQIYNSFKENSTAYIVMEYLEGKTLKEYLEEKGKLPIQEAKEILHPILIALKDVHELGILHRDIAPDNIFLTNDGRVKLLDFGASRFATTSHSKSLSVIIKQGYAPVEQYRSRGDQGTWTDVYSLAATLYKMVTGVTPEDAMERVEKEELKKPSKLGIDIPKNVENAMMNALNIKIEDRTQNVEILEKELYRDEKVKLHFVHLKKADVGKMPLWAKLAISAASLAVGVFAVLLMTGTIKYYRLIPEGFALPEGMTRVPNLINQEVLVAENIMAESELYLQIMDKQYSEYIPEGMILLQNVDRGKIVSTNQIVEVVVSGGREVFFMENVCGYPKEQAVNLLAANGLVVEIVEEYGNFAPGVVMAQSVAPQEQLHQGATVILTVSKGYDTYMDDTLEIEIPDLRGMTLEEAMAEAQSCGLYLVKSGERESSQNIGTIYSQSPAAGKTAHRGDTIEFIIVVEEKVFYMPDVQYKDESVAVAQLQELGLEVAILYEESSTVAQGKVIRQDIAAYSEVKKGDKVTLVISQGTEVIIEIYEAEPQWSEWVTELPAGVTSSDYEIEEKIQYSFRDKSTMTSLETSIPGWTQYDSVTTQGAWGEWSDWSTEQPAEGANREIEQKTQYSYSDYETKGPLPDTSTLAGWTLLSKEVFYKDDWGAFSAWSETSATESDTRDVESATAYKYRTRSWTSQVGNNTTPSGYEYSHRTEEVGEWTEYSSTPVTASDTVSEKVEVETKWVEDIRTEPTGRTLYVYYGYRYVNAVDGKVHFHHNRQSAEAQKKPGTTVYEIHYTTYTELPFREYADGFAFYTVYYDVDGDGRLNECGVVLDTTNTRAETTTVDYSHWEYRSKTTTYIYHFYKWSGYGSFTLNRESTSSDKEEKSLTVYRYRNRSPHYNYTFYRWTPYTNFSDEVATASSTRKVETRTLYKYRDRTNVITYYYYQWGAWSDWRDEVIEASDSREVQQRVLYRYREK